jgi:hypothetical protein
MAMNKTKYGRKAVLDHFFGRVSHTFPTNRWAALFSGDPTDEGLLTDELTEDGYARVEITDLMADAILGTGMIANQNDITFGPAGEDWSEITHIGIMDSATIGAGNMIYFGPAVTSRVVENEDQFIIRPGQLTITER